MKIIGLAIVLWSAAAFAGSPESDIAQWGGSGQDFKVRTRGLADTWPDAGPPVVWSRELGMGYSAIIPRGERLFTMYRRGEEEFIVCLNADNGSTIWEHGYVAPVAEKHIRMFNEGPRAAPLVTGGRVFGIGCAGVMHCLDADTGKMRWRHELWKEFEGSVLEHGYSSSPVAYEDAVIVMVGGAGHALVAFDRETGAVRWKRQDYDNSYSTPKLIDVDGQDQLLCYMATGLFGLDPKNGDELWRYEIGNPSGQNISMPVWGSDHILFISTEGAGARGLKLTRDGAKTRVEEVWSNRRLNIHHQNAVRVGRHIYASTGGMGRPGLFCAVDAKTGELAWRERGFEKATCLFADGRFIILDESGQLGLATATPDLFQIHNKVTVLEPVGASNTWTTPTLHGTTLYLRDSKSIKALDIGRPKTADPA